MLSRAENFMKSLQISRKFCLYHYKPKNEVFCANSKFKNSSPPHDILKICNFWSQNGKIWFSVQFLPLCFNKIVYKMCSKHSGNYNFHPKSSKIQSLSQIQWATYPLYALLVPTQSWDGNAGRNTFKARGQRPAESFWDQKTVLRRDTLNRLSMTLQIDLAAHCQH